jgi:hypothetical protein
MWDEYCGSYAIYIDQSNLAERSQEVVRMGKIYSQAHQVLVRLGPEADDSDNAMELLRSIGEHVFWDHDKWAVLTASLKAPDIAWSRDARGAEWNAIRKLLNRDWHTRLWVYQEVQSSKHCAILIGHRQISLRTFRMAIEWLCQGSFRNSFAMSEDLNMLAMDDWRLFIDTDDREIQVDTMISRTRFSLCKDPRDRVYALLGLLSSIS